MIDEIQSYVLRKAQLRLGINKLHEIARLAYEIHRRENVAVQRVLDDACAGPVTDNGSIGHRGKFARMKAYLLARRFPRAHAEKDFAAYLHRLSPPEHGAKIYEDAFAPAAVYVERGLEGSPLARRLGQLFPGVPARSIESVKEYRKQFDGAPFDLRKRDIVVARQQWDFVKPCPCTKNVLRCNYHVVNLGFGCPFDCSYCYLQHYANSPGIVLDANLGDFLPRLDACLRAFGGRRLRIGTGEFTDSLALDHITEYSKTLVPFFAGRNALFELKTKSDNVDNLMGLRHGGSTVISWSLNPPAVVGREERGTPPLAARLAAARRCWDEGYRIGFHFDPVIHYQGWEKDYRDTVNALFDAVPSVEWISIGTLRFHRALKSVIERRFPGTGYIYGEMVVGQDKKIRYYAALREEICKKMTGWIRRRSGSAAVYLCMEPRAMWDSVLGDARPYWMQEGAEGEACGR